MKTFSTTWKSSTKPNKQRKYRFRAPLHIRGNFMNSHLSKELRTKHNVRSLRLRLGDKVRIMRGQFKRQEGKVEALDLKKFKVFISKVEHTKRDGTKARYPIDPSNVMIVELNESKKRFKNSNPKDEKPKMEAPKPKVEAQKPKVEAQKPEVEEKSEKVASVKSTDNPPKKKKTVKSKKA